MVPSATGAGAVVETPSAPQVVLPMGWSGIFRPAVLAAVVASLLTVLGLYPVVAMVTAGFLSVLFYRQRWPGSVIQAAMGVRLGALSGLVWFAVSSIVGAVRILFLHQGAEIRGELIKVVDQAAAQIADPQVLAWFNFFKTGRGLEFLMTVILICGLFLSIVLAVIGGVLGGTILGRKGKN